MSEIKQFKVRDKRNKGWFFIDNEYLNGFAKIFGAVGTAIYVSLCRHADENEQTCFPSQELIGKELNIGTTAVKKYLKLFQKHRLISIERHRDKRTKKWLGNVYSLLDRSEWQKHEETITHEKPGSPSVYGEPQTLRCKSQGRQVSNKDTHKDKDTHSIIHLFFEYYCQRIKKQSKLGQESERLIEKRLGEGYTIEQLKKAVDNMILDPWPDRINHLDLIYCIGKQRGKPDSLEKWLNFVPKISTNNNASEGSGEASKKITITDSMLEERFGRIATKDMIKKFLREMPEQLWWKVDKFLNKRYPGSNSSSFSEAEREVIAEARINRESFAGLAQRIGK